MVTPPRLSLARLEDGGDRTSLRQRQSALARQTARSLLPPGDWHFDAEPSGRPLILAPDGTRGPDLSFSHSGPWVAAAITAWGRVGVDVEIPNQRRDARALAEAYLSPAELRAVTEEGEPALLAFWTMREAMAKLSGGGLSEALTLDVADFREARNGSCSGSRHGTPWVLAHGETAQFHIAMAWTAEHLPDQAAAMLGSALMASSSLEPERRLSPEKAELFPPQAELGRSRMNAKRPS